MLILPLLVVLTISYYIPKFHWHTIFGQHLFSQKHVYWYFYQYFCYGLLIFHNLRYLSDIYRPRMWEGNVFTLFVCMSVCVSVCLCICVSVQAITFERLDTETSFLVWWYILTISRSSLSTKVKGSRSRSLL